jgi:hypothetical protein
MEFWIWRICGHVSLETFVDDKETPKWYIIREVLGRYFEKLPKMKKKCFIGYGCDTGAKTIRRK